MIDARSPLKPGGVLLDHGTGKRIPFARCFDPETGTYEAFAPAPNGKDILCDDDDKPIVIKGKSKGRLELIPLGSAAVIGYKPPERVRKTDIDKSAGLQIYKQAYFETWQWRGEAKRCVADRWDSFLAQNDFLDMYVLRRRQG